MTASIARWRLRYYGPYGQAPPGDQHAAALDIGQRSNCSSEAVFSPADGADASFRSILAPEIVGRSPQMISIGAYKKSPRRGMPSGGGQGPQQRRNGASSPGHNLFAADIGPQPWNLRVRRLRKKPYARTDAERRAEVVSGSRRRSSHSEPGLSIIPRPAPAPAYLRAVRRQNL